MNAIGSNDQAKTALLIEDEPALARLYERRLISCGIDRVEWTGCGDRALARLDATVDLILVDWHVPGCSGIDLLNAIERGVPGVPVVVVSGLESRLDVEELPCVDYRVKPISSKDWQTIVEYAAPEMPPG